MTIRRAIFAPVGLGPLAIESQAFGASFDVLPQVDLTKCDPGAFTGVQRDALQVVPVRGPLMHHLNEDFGSYEGLLAIVRYEISKGTRTILLDFDTPGGLVSGCFDTARALRDECAAAGVRLVAYVGSQCTSAGYALACAAEMIVAPPASTSGSVGVIEVMPDATQQAAFQGMRYTLVTSGARKADGNPMAGVTKDAVAARQVHVDDLAGVFFEWVAARRGIQESAVKALEAGTFSGARAKALKLVDRVQDLASLKKELAQALAAGDDLSGKPPAAKNGDESPKDQPMKSAVRTALQAILDDDKASDGDKDEAKAALAALPDGDGDEDGKDDDGDGDGKKKPEGKAKAEDGKDDEEKKKDEADAKAAAKSNPALAAALAKAPAAVAAEVSKLLATRPDFSKELVTALTGEPLSVVRHYVRTVPKTSGQTPLAAARAALAGGGGAKPTQAAAIAGGPPVGAETNTEAKGSGRVQDRGHEQTFSIFKRGERRPGARGTAE